MAVNDKQDIRVYLDTTGLCNKVDIGRMLTLMLANRPNRHPIKVFGQPPPPIDTIWVQHATKLMTPNLSMCKEREMVSRIIADLCCSACRAAYLTPELTHDIVFLIVGDHPGAVEQLMNMGLRLEVWCWKENMSNDYKRWKNDPESYPLFTLWLLDDFIASRLLSTTTTAMNTTNTTNTTTSVTNTDTVNKWSVQHRVMPMDNAIVIIDGKKKHKEIQEWLKVLPVPMYYYWCGNDAVLSTCHKFVEPNIIRILDSGNAHGLGPCVPYTLWYQRGRWLLTDSVVLEMPTTLLTTPTCQQLTTQPTSSTPPITQSTDTTQPSSQSTPADKQVESPPSSTNSANTPATNAWAKQTLMQPRQIMNRNGNGWQTVESKQPRPIIAKRPQRCNWRFYCTAYMRDECPYLHSKEEIDYFVRNGKSKRLWKFKECRKDDCEYLDNPQSCCFRHRGENGLCPTCDRFAGHSMENCPQRDEKL